MVARDGLEPPTPAFSGLEFANAITFKTKDKSSLDISKTAYLLGQEWDKILAGQIASPVLSSPLSDLVHSVFVGAGDVQFGSFPFDWTQGNGGHRSIDLQT